MIEVSIVVAVVSWTISSESVFEGFRTRVSNKLPKIGEGLACPFCLGGWVSLPALLLMLPRTDPVTMVMQYFVLVGSSGLLTTLYAILRQVWKLVRYKAFITEDYHAHQQAHLKQVEARWPKVEKLPENATHAERLASLRKV